MLLSCEDKVNYEKPEGLIGKAKMTDLLFDMHLAVGTSNIQNVNLEKSRNYMSLVYEKHGIDSTQFAVSNLYYTAHIQEYEEIFEEVERRIQALKDIMEPQGDSITNYSEKGREAIRKKDSIERVGKIKK
jgi:protein-tyrosine-phosphatase